MKNRCWRKLLVVLVLSGGLSAHAQTYRWVDDNGQVHYTDQERGAKSHAIKSYSTPDTTRAAPQDRMEKTRRLLNAYQLERQQKREQEAEQEAQEETRRKNCIRARDDMHSYNTYGSIYRLDKDGNRVYLSEQERHTLLQRSQEDVARWCS